MGQDLVPKQDQSKFLDQIQQNENPDPMRSGIPTMQSYVIFTHIQLGVEF
jgi:hypothetical protein